MYDGVNRKCTIGYVTKLKIFPTNTKMFKNCLLKIKNAGVFFWYIINIITVVTGK
ncbi:hypothetical protein PGB90_007517 [Kerria lacca]